MNITWGLIFAFLSAVYSQDPDCCHRVRPHHACQESCDHMAMESTTIGRRRHLMSLKNNCPFSLNNFWNCVNNSAPDIWPEDTGWSGQLCCSYAQRRSCHVGCLQAESFQDIEVGCSPGEELELFDCLSRFRQKEHCCTRAPSGHRCRRKCESLFDTPHPTTEMADDVKVACDNVDPDIVTCVENYTTVILANSNPKDSVHCCDIAATQQCMDICRQAHNNMSSEPEIVKALEDGCCSIDFADPMWKCFLLSNQAPKTMHADPKTPHSNIDGAMLQCCSRAESPRCRDICIKLYSKPVSGKELWNEFDEHCQYQPLEARLLTCLADVQEPCMPGCSGLDFCENFNNRPTDLFRSCNSRSDNGAASDLGMWGNGIIKMPFMDIEVLDIAECEMDKWKAVACTLQIKPCHAKSHSNMICKSDCVPILNKCIDKSKLQKGLTIEGLCNILSPMERNAPCVTLDEYLVPSKFKDQAQDLTYPCISQDCNNTTVSRGGVCLIDRAACGFGEVCTQHACMEGCRLGEISSFIVPHGTFVRLIDSNKMDGSYQACRCGKSGELDNCQNIWRHRSIVDSCKVGGQVKDHGSQYHVDCNICTCYEGQEICSNRQCIDSETTIEQQRRYTGLPCDCSDQYVPVCAINGKTYPSACLAECTEDLNASQFMFGDCDKLSPCSFADACPAGHMCVPRRKVCMTVTNGPCPQHDCIPTSQRCEGQLYRPVCDVEGKVHANLCMLHKAGKRLAYKGACKAECSEEVEVCGHNGETYKSVCAAWSDRTTVDYHEACHAVGAITDTDINPQCETVKCPELPSSASSCVGVTPPGGCCPICAGQVRILYSKVEADRVASAMGNGILLLEDILELLRNQVVVAECDLYGFLSIEGDIVILVKSVLEMPSAVQMEVCNREAEKIEALINSRSPLIVSYLQLSPLLAATTRKAEVLDNSCNTALRLTLLHVLLITFSLFLQRLLKER